MVKVPPAFASLEEYDAFYKHVHGKTRKAKLMEEASNAIAWGSPDRESSGYTARDFISLIRELRDFIEDNVP